jgi:hypothetical protein
VTLLRVALDLDGSLEALSNSMGGLATALAARDDLELVRFRSLTAPANATEWLPTQRWFWGPWWRRGRGPALERHLPPIDLVHVAGRATPPTTTVPLIISVDDLRPLREEDGDPRRVRQLRRALDGGARLVASTHATRHEVMEILGAERDQVDVVRPPVGPVAPTTDGRALVVGVSGNAQRFFDLAPQLAALATRRGC